MRSWLVWWDVPNSQWLLPVFPGGALVGLVLTVNLIAAQAIGSSSPGPRPACGWSTSGLVLFVAASSWPA